MLLIETFSLVKDTFEQKKHALILYRVTKKPFKVVENLSNLRTLF